MADSEALYVRLDPALMARLRASAKANDRTLAAETRRWLTAVADSIDRKAQPKPGVESRFKK